MSLWDKFKAAFSEGVETVSEKTVEWSNLAKLKWEQRNIQSSINKALNELGGKVYQLYIDKQEQQLSTATKDIVAKLNSLEQDLAKKEQEIEELVEQGVDKEQLKEFKKDLELGDGKIEQITLEQSSSFIGKKLMEIQIPKNVLIGAIVRNEQVIIPDGQTKFQAGDKVTLLGQKEDVEKALELLD